MRTELEKLDPMRWYYLVLWSDYDGGNVEPFEERRDAEDRCSELMMEESRERNGFSFDGIIYGKTVKTKVVERVKAIEFE